MITRAQWIAFRVQEGQYPLALVVVHEVNPEQRNHRAQHANQPQQQPPAQAGQKQCERPRAAHHQRRAQIRLLGDQDERNGGDQRPAQYVIPAGWQRLVGEEPGHHHRHGKLHDLRGLKSYHTQIQPALRALGNVADHHNRQQQQHASQINPRRPKLEVTRRQLRQRQHDGKSQAQSDGLANHQVEIALAGAVEHHQPQARYRQQPDQQPRIEIKQLEELAAGLLDAVVRQQQRSEPGRCGFLAITLHAADRPERVECRR